MKFEIIIITLPDEIAHESHWITELFKAGLKKLHVRKPGYSRKEMQTFISRIPSKYHSRLVIHSHYSLAKKYSLGGIHLNERAKKKSLPAVYDKKTHWLSASFHSLSDVARARRKYDTILLSPIFNSISKKGYRSAFEPEELKNFLRQYKNLIALGGIDEKTVVLAQKMGFRGAATLGYIWESKDPLKAFEGLRSKIK